MRFVDGCPFCCHVRGDVPYSDGLVTDMMDDYPLNKGHRLIFPARHVGKLADLTHEERAELWARVEKVAAEVEGDFNIGLNDGPLAGQTVPHLHVHVIPRHEGDTADPRGGVRWVIPERADYWTPEADHAE